MNAEEILRESCKKKGATLELAKHINREIGCKLRDKQSIGRLQRLITPKDAPRSTTLEEKEWIRVINELGSGEKIVLSKILKHLAGRYGYSTVGGVRKSAVEVLRYTKHTDWLGRSHGISIVSAAFIKYVFQNES